MTTFITNLSALATDETAQRYALSFSVQAIVSFATSAAVFALLSTFLWAWLALLAALAAGWVLGARTAVWTHNQGYDHVVKGVAHIASFFRKS